MQTDRNMQHGAVPHDQERASATDAPAELLGYIETHADLPPHVSPAAAAVTVTAALVDRLTSGQAHGFVVALPSTVQPLFEHCLGVREAGKAVDHIRRPEFLDRVGDILNIAPAAAELVAITVFRALQRLLPPDVTAHVTQQLPRDLQDLWLSPQPPNKPIASDLEVREQVLDAIERSGVLPRNVPASAAFSAVMCLLAQRVSGGEARNLLLGLPHTLRPLVQRCMLHAEDSILTFGVDELTAAVAEHLHTTLEDAARLIPVVFESVRRALPEEELSHVASQLPDDLRALWSGA